MKQFVRNWAPPALVKAIGGLRPSRSGLKGPYCSWTQARAHSSGYDNTVILETVDRITSSALADGKACQDGVVVDGAPIPISACRLPVADCGAGKKAPITGGGLWRRVGVYLASLPHLCPCCQRAGRAVVEQPHFVALGRERYRTDHLDFFDMPSQRRSAAHCPSSPDAVDFSQRVLQYLEDP